jgi:hypothetical protein
MKIMAIGDVGPREVIEVDDDRDKVIPPTNVQNNDQPSTSGSHDRPQVQQMQHQTVPSSTQVIPASDQPSANDQAQMVQPVTTLQEIIH